MRHGGRGLNAVAGRWCWWESDRVVRPMKPG